MSAACDCTHTPTHVCTILHQETKGNHCNIICLSWWIPICVSQDIQPMLTNQHIFHSQSTASSLSLSSLYFPHTWLNWFFMPSPLSPFVYEAKNKNVRSRNVFVMAAGITLVMKNEFWCPGFNCCSAAVDSAAVKHNVAQLIMSTDNQLCQCCRIAPKTDRRKSWQVREGKNKWGEHINEEGHVEREEERQEGERWLKEQNRGVEKAKEVTVVPFPWLSEVCSKNWKQWRPLISHHLHRVYSGSDKPWASTQI